MPLYEYQCDACGHRFELIQKFSDALVETCPSCGGVVHKLQSAPAIQFKGSGFYITDYAKKEHVAAAKADSGPADSKEKTEKGEKADKGEKVDKSEKSGRTDKSSSSSDSSDSSSASAAKPAPATSTTAPATSTTTKDS